MEIKAKILSFLPQRKDPLDKFAANHEGWEEFISTVKEDTETPKKELLQFAEDVSKSMEKHIQRKKSIFTFIEEEYHNPHLGYLVNPMSLVTDHVMKKIISNNFHTKLEKKKQYISVNKNNFAVLSPDGKKIILAKIEQIGEKRFPAEIQKLPVTEKKTHQIKLPEENRSFLLEAVYREGGKEHSLSIKRISRGHQ